MPFDNAGTNYTPAVDFAADRDNGVPFSAARFMTQINDLADALDSLASRILTGAPSDLNSFAEAATAIGNLQTLIAALQAADSTIAANLSAETLRATTAESTLSTSLTSLTSTVNSLVAGAPGTLDTFLEAYNRFITDESAVTALTATVGGKLTASSNLSDLASASTARTNLGLGSLAVLSNITASLISDASANGRSLITAANYAAMKTLLAIAASDVSGLATVATSGLASDLTGNLAVARLNGGTGASSSTFWRGDGTWATPAGGGNVSNSGTPTSGQIAEWTNATTVQGVAVTGTGSIVRATSPTLVTPALGTPASGTLTNCTGLPVAGGGTGASDAATARTNLAAVGYTSASNVQSVALAGTNTSWKFDAAVKVGDVIESTSGGFKFPDGTTQTTSAAVPVGTSIAYNGSSAPAGYLKENGAAVSRTTYAALFAALVASSTVTITIASPGVVTWTGHGRSANDPVKFTTTGALPTGLTSGTTYYIVGASITTNTFQVSATPGGSAINTSGSQSGTHTAIHAPHGDGDGSTTFNVPDSRGEFHRGWDDGRGVDTSRSFGSWQDHDYLSHNHQTASQSGVAGSNGASSSAGGAYIGGIASNNWGGQWSASSGGTETRPRNKVKLYCIKY